MSEAILGQSPNAPVPVADYAHATEVPLGNGKNMVYLCGMGPRDKTTNQVPGITYNSVGEVHDYDFEAQARNVFKNIDIMLKDMGGRGLRDVVDVQVFLVNIPRDFAKFNKLWKEYLAFDDGWRPSRTTVQVSALPLKEIFVELKCVALLDSER